MSVVGIGDGGARFGLTLAIVGAIAGSPAGWGCKAKKQDPEASEPTQVASAERAQEPEPSEPEPRPAIIPAFDPPKGFGHVRDSNPPTFLGADETFYMFINTPLVSDGPGRSFEDVRTDLYHWARSEDLAIADMDLWDTVHEGLGGTKMQVVMARLGSSDGDRITVFLGMFDCEELGLSFDIRYLAGPDMTREAGARRLVRTGCPGPAPVSPEKFPTVLTAFSGACDGKDGRACKLLGDLVASGEIDLPGADPETYYARACKLGFADACP